MNEIIETIKKRRSVRAYLEKSVEQEIIDKIIEAGLWSPTARHQQKWKFIVVTDKKVLSRITELMVEEGSEKYPHIKERAKAKEDPILYNAPLFIVVAEPKDYHWDHIDGAIAAQNMVLAGESLGLNSCYIGMTRVLKDNKEFNELLQMPSGYRIIISVIFGYGDEEPDVKDRVEDTVIMI